MYSKYKNKNSIVLESSKLRAEFTPDPGGKMVSLISKETGFEFLVQRPADIYKDQPFDGLFTEGECSGFDDMFPTIDACIYKVHPWEGVKMADHGEVWSLPWKYKLNNDSLEMSVKGVRFPYELSKHIFFTDNNCIRLEYELTNNSPEDFEFLWAGHLMINIVEGTKVLVPEDCRKAVTVLTNSVSKFGEIREWPYFKDSNGNLYRADISRSKDVKGFEKYYFSNKLKDGWCELEYPDHANRLKVSFPVTSVPYLGILMNEYGWDGLYNIIIEPCTVCYDRPDVAKQYGQVSKINGLSSYHWYIDLKI